MRDQYVDMSCYAQAHLHSKDGKLGSGDGGLLPSPPMRNTFKPWNISRPRLSQLLGRRLRACFLSIQTSNAIRIDLHGIMAAHDLLEHSISPWARRTDITRVEEQGLAGPAAHVHERNASLVEIHAADERGRRRCGRRRRAELQRNMQGTKHCVCSRVNCVIAQMERW